MKNISNVQLIHLPQAQDWRGSLCVAEHEKHIPFKINRCFWVFDVPNTLMRGEHAHKICHQFLVCVSGECAVVSDDGSNQQEFALKDKNIGLYVPPMIWTTQYKFSQTATLLVIASHPYDPNDYIRDYQEFLAHQQ
jgi:dTDP-4-dehydrorhamnose 3,5-epimerase-like enzyme